MTSIEMRRYTTERARVCHEALEQLDALMPLGEFDMRAAWRAYDTAVAAHQPAPEVHQAIRQAVQSDAATIAAFTPQADQPSIDEGGEVGVTWCASDTGLVDFATLFMAAGPQIDTSLSISDDKGLVEIPDLNTLQALIVDLQRAADCWAWIDRARTETEAANAERT